MSKEPIGEKIYYSDSGLKVTNLRVTCKSVSVPVSKIDGLRVNPSIDRVAMSVGLTICSLVLIFFSYILPSDFMMPFIVGMLVISASGLVWFCLILRKYLEVLLTVEGREISLLNAGIFEKAYVESVVDALRKAEEDQRKFVAMKETGRLSKEASNFTLTETMRLKFIIEDYERIKAEVPDKNTSQDIAPSA
ncbi:MAG TPA: hypothetical protein DET40_14085 [Lentisphaeria bacterium]|nr:MAG: hypothetical protein A2X45_03005 [Lentisphaerae bacterium GWF2_50_93]HCE44668.1 hypothetical protein [Lentisphaeria bacterium]